MWSEYGFSSGPYRTHFPAHFAGVISNPRPTAAALSLGSSSSHRSSQRKAMALFLSSSSSSLLPLFNPYSSPRTQISFRSPLLSNRFISYLSLAVLISKCFLLFLLFVVWTKLPSTSQRPKKPKESAVCCSVGTSQCYFLICAGPFCLLQFHYFVQFLFKILKFSLRWWKRFSTLAISTWNKHLLSTLKFFTI